MASSQMASQPERYLYHLVKGRRGRGDDLTYATLHQLGVAKSSQTDNDKEGPEFNLVGVARGLRRDEAVLAERLAHKRRRRRDGRMTIEAGGESAPGAGEGCTGGHLG